jgi:dolichol-phosphate mannosyltransferase
VRRGAVFLAVGALGFIVQLASLAMLTSMAGWHWLPATLASVELAVVHNFVWHDRWTWRDCAGGGRLARLLKFNLGNGLTSLGGNAALMAVLAGVVGLPPLAANLITVATLAAMNFALADAWVFRRDTRSRPPAPGAQVESAVLAIARTRSTPRRCGS